MGEHECPDGIHIPKYIYRWGQCWTLREADSDKGSDPETSYQDCSRTICHWEAAAREALCVCVPDPAVTGCCSRQQHWYLQSAGYIGSTGWWLGVSMDRKTGERGIRVECGNWSEIPPWKMCVECWQLICGELFWRSAVEEGEMFWHGSSTPSFGYFLQPGWVKHSTQSAGCAECPIPSDCGLWPGTAIKAAQLGPGQGPARPAPASKLTGRGWGACDHNLWKYGTKTSSWCSMWMLRSIFCMLDFNASPGGAALRDFECLARLGCAGLVLTRHPKPILPIHLKPKNRQFVHRIFLVMSSPCSHPLLCDQGPWFRGSMTTAVMGPASAEKSCSRTGRLTKPGNFGWSRGNSMAKAPGPDYHSHRSCGSCSGALIESPHCHVGKGLQTPWNIYSTFWPFCSTLERGGVDCFVLCVNFHIWKNITNCSWFINLENINNWKLPWKTSVCPPLSYSCFG